MDCRDVRSFADAYLDDELLVETNQALLAHLGQCPACRSNMKARQALRARLKRAFEAQRALDPTADFSASLKNGLRPNLPLAASARWVKRMRWVAVTALLVAITAFAWQWTRDSQQSRAVSQTTQTPAALVRLSESAAGDHRDCALRHQLAEAPIDLEQAASYDRALPGLDQAVRVRTDSLPAPLERLGAHACLWKHQRFGHLLFSYRGEIVSLLVTTPAGDAGSFATSEPAACPKAGGFSIACFAAPRHVVFVVSDLPSTETLTLANALAPSVRNHLARAITALRDWLHTIS
jgi:anti-sigma factor RsiW